MVVSIVLFSEPDLPPWNLRVEIAKLPIQGDQTRIVQRTGASSSETGPGARMNGLLGNWIIKHETDKSSLHGEWGLLMKRLRGNRNIKLLG